MIAPKNNQDKAAWCDLGEQAERDFLEKCWRSGVSVWRNPAKTIDKYAVDSFVAFLADIKTVRTEFRTSGKYGFDPRFAITLNVKDVENYSEKCPNVIIIFDVSHRLYQGTHIAPLGFIRKAISKGMAKRHEYLERTQDEKNAKASYVLDVRWFPMIDGALAA